MGRQRTGVRSSRRGGACPALGMRPPTRAGQAPPLRRRPAATVVGPALTALAHRLAGVTPPTTGRSTFSDWGDGGADADAAKPKGIA